MTLYKVLFRFQLPNTLTTLLKTTTELKAFKNVKYLYLQIRKNT